MSRVEILSLFMALVVVINVAQAVRYLKDPLRSDTAAGLYALTAGLALVSVLTFGTSVSVVASFLVAVVGLVAFRFSGRLVEVAS